MFLCNQIAFSWQALLQRGSHTLPSAPCSTLHQPHRHWSPRCWVLLRPPPWAWPSHHVPLIQAHPDSGRHQGLLGQASTVAAVYPSLHTPKGTVAPVCPAMLSGFGDPLRQRSQSQGYPVPEAFQWGFPMKNLRI